MNDTLLLSPERCAELLGIGRTLVYQLLAGGQLKSIKLGRRRLIPRDALRAFVAAERERQEAQEVTRGDTLLGQVRALQERALSILEQAEEAGNWKVALGAIREARGNLKLLAKLVGELQEVPEAGAQATAQALVVMVDGKAVEDEYARRAAARALLERFTKRGGR